ncbi:MAG: chitobiase/beta-hexosaminidase C-terminal domain-containing protein [Spirochaetales bacterium]|nr:chitobiase/beta-hexosaminidase C-terminal domain-containing protein [Spirochaetales bacterium]
MRFQDHAKRVFFCLAWLCILSSLCAQEYIGFSNPPGFYNENLSLVLRTSSPDNHLFYQFINDNGDPGPWIPFVDSIELTAVPGEEADYRLNLRAYENQTLKKEETLYYSIDKKRPFPPLLSLPQGEYQDDIVLTFFNKEDGKIMYSINNLILEGGNTWNGTHFMLKGEAGKRKDYTIQAYVLDKANNRSDIITYHYIINMTRDASGTPVLSIKSPVPGTFANKQLLYISSSNFSWIKYSVDGKDPGASGMYYTEPVLLDVTGKITLKVVGMPRLADSFPVESSVTYTVAPPGTTTINVTRMGGTYFEDTRVVLSSLSGNLFHYSLSEQSPSGKADPTRGEVFLQGKKGESAFFPLRVRIDKQGKPEQSEFRFFYCIDKRLPAITGIRINGTGPESTFAEVSITGTRGADIYYTLDNSIPDRSSFHYTGPFRITRKEAFPTGTILLRVRAFDPRGEQGSEVKWRYISFLYESPRVPEVTLSTQGKTNIPVTISIGENENIVYELSADGIDPPDPSRESEKAYEDIVFSLPFGMEKKYIVKCASTDKDIFTVSPPVRFEFTIDRLPPLNPVVQGQPANGFTKNPVTFSFKRSDFPVYFQVTQDGSEPKLAGDESRLYKEPITVYGAQDKEITYRIKSVSIDELQNVSSSLFDTVFTIDNKIPLSPTAPKVKNYKQDNAALYSISWDIPRNASLYYYVQTTQTQTMKQDEQFLVYKEPLIINFSKEVDGVIIKGFIQDLAGNKSDVVLFKINPTKKKTEPPSVTGVVDGGYYDKPVTIELKGGNKTIHYELTDNGTNPGAITAASPQYTLPITLDIPYGETKEYKLRACVMEDNMLNVTSQELFIRFVIDKIPPEAPRIKGVDDRGYYYKTTKASFYPAEDTIYYEIIPEHKYSNIIVPQSFSKYNGEITLDTPPGSISHYIILAFSVDKAGNISRERPEWRISIDKNGIFVSSSGNDLGDGTQKRPFASINKAVSYSYKSGRKQIMLSHGVFKMLKGIGIQEDIDIQGGFNPLTWEAGGPGDLSIIDSSEYFIFNDYLFVVSETRFSLHNIEFRDTKKKFPGFISNAGGKIVLDNVKMIPENPGTISALSAEKGSMEITGSEFECRASEKGSFISALNCKVYITSTEFQGPESGKEFTAIKLIRSEECLIQDVSIFPGKVLITRGAAIEDSLVLFNNCKIDTGKGINNAVGLKVKNSVVNIQMSVLNCNEESTYAMGISSENSKLTIDSSLINVNSTTGATGIRVNGGLINVFLSTIKSCPIPVFLYLFDLKNEKGSFVGNLITGSDSADSLCGVFYNSESYWINNTIVCGNSPSSAFIINGEKTPQFINNIIARPGEPGGNAFHFIGGTKVTSPISYNNLSGWKNLLKIDFVKANTGSFTYSPSQEFYKNSVQELNMFDGDSLGGIIHGNISEVFSRTFINPDQENYHLAPSSLCIDQGMDVSNYIFSGIVMDIDGEERPAAYDDDIKPTYDIGADEFYPLN